MEYTNPARLTQCDVFQSTEVKHQSTLISMFSCHFDRNSPVEKLPINLGVQVHHSNPGAFTLHTCFHAE